MKHSIEYFANQLRSLEHELNDLKDKINNIQANNSNTLQIIPYFHYTTIVSSKTANNRILGSFIVKNKGTEPLHNPYICIRLTPYDTLSLTAKLGAEMSIDSEINPHAGISWYYINDKAEKQKANGEYWLKPISIETLESEETISVNNFQIECQDNQHITIEGFIYGDEIPNGLQSLNTIQITHIK